MTIRLKLFLSFLGVALVPLALLGWQFYASAKLAFIASVRSHLTSLATVQRDRLQSNFTSGTFTPERIDRVSTGYFDFLGETGETLIVGHDETGAAVLEAPRRFGDTTPSAAIVSLADAQDGGFAEDVADGRGKQVFAASEYLKEKNWGVVVKIDRDEVLAPFYALFGGPLLVSLMFVVLAVAFISLLVTESFLAPIRDLTDVTRAISFGNLKASIDPDTLAKKDEIGDLGRAFDRTVVSLKLAMVDLDAETKVRKAAAKPATPPPTENPVI